MAGTWNRCRTSHGERLQCHLHPTWCLVAQRREVAGSCWRRQIFLSGIARTRRRRRLQTSHSRQPAVDAVSNSVQDGQEAQQSMVRAAQLHHLRSRQGSVQYLAPKPVETRQRRLLTLVLDAAGCLAPPRLRRRPASAWLRWFPGEAAGVQGGGCEQWIEEMRVPQLSQWPSTKGLVALETYWRRTYVVVRRSAVFVGSWTRVV